MNMKTAWQWLDRLTAWGFIIGLCCWSYHVFMIQSPARFPNFGRGEVLGDFTGVLLVMLPYSACMGIPFVSLGSLRGWPGDRLGWRMILWMHTRLLPPTLLSYFAAYTLYENAEQLADVSLSLNIMSSAPIIALVYGCYFFSAEKYYQRNNEQKQNKSRIEN